MKIGSGFLPVLLGQGVHSYRVTKNPLPADAEVIGATMSPDLRCVVLLIQSETFAAVPDCEHYPEIEPIMAAVKPGDV
jgi:hypothetical protein